MKVSRIVPLVLLAILVCTGCGGMKDPFVKRDMDSPAINVSAINSNISNAKLKQIIIAACTSHGWKVDNSSDSSVTATLNHMNRETVTIEIPFSRDKVEFLYKSSTNMRYDGTKIHRSYNRWLKTLETDITNGIVAAK